VETRSIFLSFRIPLMICLCPQSCVVLDLSTVDLLVVPVQQVQNVIMSTASSWRSLDTW